MVLSRCIDRFLILFLEINRSEPSEKRFALPEEKISKESEGQNIKKMSPSRDNKAIHSLTKKIK